MKTEYWFQQAIQILTECNYHLTYAFTENTLSNNDMIKINKKIRELYDIIPDWDATFKKRDKLDGY